MIVISSMMLSHQAECVFIYVCVVTQNQSFSYYDGHPTSTTEFRADGVCKYDC